MTKLKTYYTCWLVLSSVSLTIYVGLFKRSVKTSILEQLTSGGVQYGKFPVVHHNETRRLEDIIYESQNPTDCIGARKAICKLRTKHKGLFSQMHAYSYCLQIALTTNRTLIIDTTELPHIYLHGLFLRESESCDFYRDQAIQNAIVKWKANPNREIINNREVPVQIEQTTTLFQPGHIPPQILPFFTKSHLGDPAVWWTAQSINYLMRPTELTKREIQKHKAVLKFQHPIVGIHLRRTDKLIVEAKYQSNDMYMEHVRDWYEKHHKSSVIRRVYVATDDASAVQELRKEYPEYLFLSDDRIIGNAQYFERESLEGSLGITLDVSMLSECDYIVCTYSSNIGRVLYEILHLKYEDQEAHILSIDYDYQFDSYLRVYQAIEKNAESRNEVAFEIGDRLSSIVLEAKPHFLYGTNLHTNQKGFYLRNKVKPIDIASPQNARLPFGLKSAFTFVRIMLNEISWGILLTMLCLLIIIFIMVCAMTYFCKFRQKSY